MRPPPVALTFLAPAVACNQRCPQCIIDLSGEPVRDFSLGPKDYVRFVERFVEAEVPIQAVAFQGYEVTLPQSWPYLREVFRFCRPHSIRCSFITNGMLLHKWAEEVAEMQPRRISISFDGSDPEVHDALRGPAWLVQCDGHKHRTLSETRSLHAFRAGGSLDLYDEQNFRSLLKLPRVLTRLGIRQWMVVGGVAVENRHQIVSVSSAQLAGWFQQLADVAHQADIRFYVSDEFGHFKAAGSRTRDVPLRHIFDLRFFYRMYPTGHVRVGREFLESWDTGRHRRWNPSTDDPLEVVDYWQHANQEHNDQIG